MIGHACCVMGHACCVMGHACGMKGHACGMMGYAHDVMGHACGCDMAWNLLFSFKYACRSTIRGSRIWKPPGLHITPFRPCCLSDAALSLFAGCPRFSDSAWHHGENRCSGPSDGGVKVVVVVRSVC